MNQASKSTGSDSRQFTLALVMPTDRDFVVVDDPKSPAYRYADTGYIAGSRKEAAASQTILRAKREGLRVQAREIDWDDLETNPREAKQLITKSNLFGTVNWQDLRAAGLEPGAGFLIDRVYAAIGSEPEQDAPQARKDYAISLQLLRDRLEACKTVDEVVDALDHLRTEFEGSKLTAEEDGEAKRLLALQAQTREQWRESDRRSTTAYNVSTQAASEVAAIEREIANRKRRGWQITVDYEDRLSTAKSVADVRAREWAATRQGEESELRKKLLGEMQSISAQLTSIVANAQRRNRAENPFHRGLTLMGDRFIKVVLYRKSNKGSDAFRKHVASASAGLIRDWTWLESEVSRSPRVTKESVRFYFKVADRYDRVGGRPVIVDSTADLKSRFRLRDVQSGKWVLRDVVSAKFHTEQTGAAFADLADLMGIGDHDISHGGRLAMAFGARGKGSTGAKGGAAMAHYEFVHRVINVTKEKGGGSLGHEWFHSLDNLIVELVTGMPGAMDYATEKPDMLPPSELQDAFHLLCREMLTGNCQVPQVLRYTSADVKMASVNLKPTSRSAIPRAISDAGSLSTALEKLESLFGLNPGEMPSGRGKKNYLDWRRIAVAHYGGNSLGGEIEVCTGAKMSSFMAEAIKLEGGGKPYFTKVCEMAARAFQAWLEDRLAEQGRRNDYLSVFADNKYYVDPITQINWKPFPEGEERIRINAAFDRLAAALRSLLKA